MKLNFDTLVLAVLTIAFLVAFCVTRDASLLTLTASLAGATAGAAQKDLRAQQTNVSADVAITKE